LRRADRSDARALNDALAARAAQGTIIASFGRRYLVESDDGLFLECVTRGKQGGLACGDRVRAVVTSAREGVIEAVDPRRTLLQRAAAHRAKLIAANATQLAIVVAGEPSFSDELVCRALLAGEHAGMQSLIVLNKADLAAPTQAARARLAPICASGYRLVEISARHDVSPLRRQLGGETTVLLGQSGMGKSTLVNALVPDANAETREISRFLDSGKHTTTHSRLYRLDGDTAVIDCPGLQELGLAHLDPEAIELGFPELRGLRGRCRFRDCRHREEPGCAVGEAVAAGSVHPRRLELFHRIRDAEAAARA
jgi:ribosome biogenesis GTPase